MLLHAHPPAARGRYDRGLTPAARFSEQREWILLAIAQTLRDATSTSLADLVRAGGFGRNTFYAHFPSLDAAVDSLMQVVTERLHQVLQLPHDTSTPTVQVHGFAVAWASALHELGIGADALFGPSSHPTVVRYRESTRQLIHATLGELLQRGQRAGMFALRLSQIRTCVAAAALEAMSAAAERPPIEATTPTADAIAEVLLRLLR